MRLRYLSVYVTLLFVSTSRFVMVHRRSSNLDSDRRTTALLLSCEDDIHRVAAAGGLVVLFQPLGTVCANTFFSRGLFTSRLQVYHPRRSHAVGWSYFLSFIWHDRIVFSCTCWGALLLRKLLLRMFYACWHGLFVGGSYYRFFGWCCYITFWWLGW